MSRKNVKKHMQPREGDLIEIERRLYSHWAIYTGNGKIIHRGAAPGTGSKAALDLWSVSSKSGILSDKALVREDDLAVVAGESAVFINNKYDGVLPVRTPKQIIKRAMARLRETGYNILTHNCEHFAVEIRYGVVWSSQVYEPPWQRDDIIANHYRIQINFFVTQLREFHTRNILSAPQVFLKDVECCMSSIFPTNLDKSTCIPEKDLDEVKNTKNVSKKSVTLPTETYNSDDSSYSGKHMATVSGVCLLIGVILNNGDNKELCKTFDSNENSTVHDDYFDIDEKQSCTVSKIDENESCTDSYIDETQSSTVSIIYDNESCTDSDIDETQSSTVSKIYDNESCTDSYIDETQSSTVSKIYDNESCTDSDIDENEICTYSENDCCTVVESKICPVTDGDNENRKPDYPGYVELVVRAINIVPLVDKSVFVCIFFLCLPIFMPFITYKLETVTTNSYANRLTSHGTSKVSYRPSYNGRLVNNAVQYASSNRKNRMNLLSYKNN